MARRKSSAATPPPIPKVTPVSGSLATQETTVIATSPTHKGKWTPKCYILRVLSEFEKTLVGIDFALDLSGPSFEPLVSRLTVHDRLVLQVWEGGPTGKVRLVDVQEIQQIGAPNSPSGMTTIVKVEQTWGWGRGITNPEEVLEKLFLTAEPYIFAVCGLSGCVEKPLEEEKTKKDLQE